jgi:hypothetical protein
MSLRHLTLALVLGMGLVSTAEAQLGDSESFFRLGVFAGYRSSGSLGETLAGEALTSRDLDAAAAWGLVVVFEMSSRVEIELLLDRSRSSVSPPGIETWSTFLLAGLRFPFRRDRSRWFPFLGVGLGVHSVSPTADVASASWFAGQVEGGVEWAIGSRVALRGDLRTLVTRIPEGEAFCGSGECLDYPESGWMIQGEATAGLLFTF